MSAVGCQWSHDGSILAVAGTMTVAGAAEKDSNVVQVIHRSTYIFFGMATIPLPLWFGDSIPGHSLG